METKEDGSLVLSTSTLKFIAAIWGVLAVIVIPLTSFMLVQVIELGRNQAEISVTTNYTANQLTDIRNAQIQVARDISAIGATVAGIDKRVERLEDKKK